MIEMLMCDFRIDGAAILRDFDIAPDRLGAMFSAAAQQFPGMLRLTGHGLKIHPEGHALTRMIARAFDAYEIRADGHSSAI